MTEGYNALAINSRMISLAIFARPSLENGKLRYPFRTSIARRRFEWATGTSLRIFIPLS